MLLHFRWINYGLKSSIITLTKKKLSKEEANKIAASIVKKEIEKNTCQNIACRHLKSKHLGDKRQCMVVTCPCSEFMKKV